MSCMYKVINGAMYSVITEDEYFRCPTMWQDKFLAVKMSDGYIYPVKQVKTEPSVNAPVGMYVSDCMSYFTKPKTEAELKEHSSEGIIDFDAADNMREFIQTKQRFASANRNIMCCGDSIFAPETTPDDTPEMVALKQAISDKQIDLDKYESRFGANYNNDKRLLRKNSITFGKLRSICKALDIKATITFEDRNGDVPNPIGRVITAELVGDEMTIEEDE